MYKPDLRAACCPHYTIRLDSDEFRASKDQRQVQNRLNTYILGETYTKEAARLFPLSREQAKKRNTDFKLVDRVHESEKDELKTPPNPAHAFTVTLEPDTFTEEKFLLFENYQRLVHHEPPSRITRHGFKNFLCSSPLPRSKEVIDGRARRLGSYHQCYRIDGELIAMGVLDLLPQCVSAVYFMYDESVHKHAFGKLGALREIALAKEDGYRWWYAGFYIHNCVKMRYKGDYSPQYILDPESYAWDLLDGGVKKKLDETKYLSLSSAQAEGVKPPPALADSEGTTEPSNESKDGSEDEVGSDDDPDLSDPDTPLFDRPMPGVLTKAQLSNDIDLDRIMIRVRGVNAQTQDLAGWSTSDMDNPNSIKGNISELVAAVGVDAARRMIVAFS